MALKKQNLILFIILSTILFIILIFPNATGAADENMISIFEIDEYAQYPHLIRMLTVGDSAYQTIRNFVIYLHYFYGYPFYFFSALSALPVRLILGADWVQQTQTIITVLRQMLSVLPMLISIGFWIYMIDGFKTWYKTILSSLLLALLPAVFENNFWWHPDSLAFLFVTLTFFFLFRDKQEFKLNFWLAACSAGLAIGTKHLGEFFVLAIPLYLGISVYQKKLTIKKSFLLAAGFVLLMFVSIIISNPLLLLPIERGEVIRYQIMQWQETTQGSLVAHQSMLLSEFILFISNNAIGIPLILLSFACFILGIINKNKRLQILLTAAYLVPYGLVIFTGSSLRPNYLIPFFIPFLCITLHFLPEGFSKNWKKNWFSYLITAVIILQIIWILPNTVKTYQHVLERENRSPSIGFYKNLAPFIPADTQTIFRDWLIYIPENTAYQVHFDWENATYPRINALDPDLIILEESRIKLFSRSDPDVTLSENVDGDEWYEFYSDANDENIPGYQLLYADNYAKAFIKINE